MNHLANSRRLTNCCKIGSGLYFLFPTVVVVSASERLNKREINEAVIVSHRVPKGVERVTQHFVVVSYLASQCFPCVIFHNRALNMIQYMSHLCLIPYLLSVHVGGEDIYERKLK